MRETAEAVAMGRPGRSTSLKRGVNEKSMFLGGDLWLNSGDADGIESALQNRLAVGQTLVRRSLQSSRRDRAAFLSPLSQTTRRARAGRRTFHPTRPQEIRTAVLRPEASLVVLESVAG